MIEQGILEEKRDIKKKLSDTILLEDEKGKTFPLNHLPLNIDYEGQIDSKEIIKYNLHGQETELIFEDYLDKHYRVSYRFYYKLLKENPTMDQAEVLILLHKNSVLNRKEIAKRLSKTQSSEIQEVTAVEDSYFFIKSINEIYLNGLSAETAADVNDRLDKIDDFININPKEIIEFAKEIIDEEGNPKIEIEDIEDESIISIGIQRTFAENIGKEQNITNNPVIYLPEKPDIVIFRTYQKENKEYYYVKENYSCYNKMFEIRNTKALKKNKSPKEYAREKGREGNYGLPLVSEVLGKNGFTKQAEMVIGVFTNLLNQWNNFRETDNFKKLSKVTQEKLKKQFDILEKLKIPEIIKIIENS